MATAYASAPTRVTAATIGPVTLSERLPVLDILRGFAILGMFIVHSMEKNPNDTSGGPIGATVNHAITWLLVSKAYYTFAILFGVGFAIQLRRADARGENVRWRFLRRLLGVAAFGVLTAALFGAIDIIGYAWSGVWLLVVRRWSTRALLVALLVSTTLIGVWNVAVGSYQWATMGVEGANAVYQSARPLSPAMQAAQQEVHAAEQGTSFFRLAAARVVARVYLGPNTDLWGDWQRGYPGRLLWSLSSGLTLFLIGLVAVRLGVLERPADHRRLLAGLMFVGAALWALGQWELSKILWPATWLIPNVRIARTVQSGFGFFDNGYLALTYIGAITLVVGFSKAWARRLNTMFGAAGRLALTNYILQFAVLGVVVDKYGFGVKGWTPQLGVVAAVVLFGTLAVFSRWWLGRFRLGPAEWLLRSLTYARFQPLRRLAAQGV